MGKSLLWAGGDALTLFILIRLLRIPPLESGIIFALACFWNALMDLWCGSWLDKLGRLRGRVVMAATLCAGASFIVLPILPEHSALPTLLALFLFRTCYSLIDVSHNATTIHLAATCGHLAMARWRSVLSAAAAIIIGFLAIFIISAGGYSTLTASRIFCAVGVVALLLMMPLSWLLAATGSTRRTSSHGYRSVVTSLPGRRLLLFFLTQAVGITALAFVAKSVLHVASAGVAHAMLLLALMRLTAAYLWSPLDQRIGTFPAMCWGYATCAAAAIVLVWLLPLGLVPALAALALFGICSGGVAFLGWAGFSRLLAEVVKDADIGVARGFGWYTALQKSALGISGLLTGFWLNDARLGLDSPYMLRLSVIAVGLLILSAALVMLLQSYKRTDETLTR